jgi:hypothetical protein
MDCRCAAVAAVVTPSIFERERYCGGEQAEECPVHAMFARRGAPISVDEYWRIWLSPPEDAAQEVRNAGVTAQKP